MNSNSNNQNMNNNQNQINNQPFVNNNGSDGLNNFNNQQFIQPNFNDQNQINNQPFVNSNVSGEISNLEINNHQIPTNTQNSNDKKNKLVKLLLIGGGTLLFIILIIVIVNLISKSSQPKGKKLTCTTHHAIMGVYYDETYEYYIKDGSVSVKYITKTDLKKTKLSGDSDEWAKQKIDALKEECKTMDGAKCDYKHSKGNYLETIVILDDEYWGDKFEGQLAEDIYSEQKSRHINGEVDGSVYTCK